MILLIFSLFISSPYTESSPVTPDKADWYRTIYIGSNNNNYFCYVIKFSQPGSHYVSYDSVFICKFSMNQNELVEKHLLRARTFEDTACIGVQTISDVYVSDLVVEKYLEENKVFYGFSSDYLKDFILQIDKDGLIVKKGNNKFILINSDSLVHFQKWMFNNTISSNSDNILKYIKRLNDDAIVVDYFRTQSYYYFIIQNGMGFYDCEFYQYIAYIKSDYVNNIEKQLRKLK